MNKKEKQDELLSLNSEFSEFKLQELEERLETDPLAVGGLLNLLSFTDSSSMDTFGYCPDWTQTHCDGYSF